MGLSLGDGPVVDGDMLGEEAGEAGAEGRDLLTDGAGVPPAPASTPARGGCPWATAGGSGPQAAGPPAASAVVVIRTAAAPSDMRPAGNRM
ncbi:MULTISPECIES: hypothetical protein [unclassified Streptomyces]|uniref:hypothetical protein n=1 Tax=unclassified Streptomyces TaxID=2593676 RepID=UPI00364D86DC